MESLSEHIIIIFDAIIAAVGVYLAFSAWRMKKTGEISTLIAAQEEISKCRDKDGFIQGIYKKMAGIGLLGAVLGAVSLFNDVWDAAGSEYVRTAVRLLYLLGCFWLLGQIRREREKFF